MIEPRSSLIRSLHDASLPLPSSSFPFPSVCLSLSVSDHQLHQTVARAVEPTRALAASLSRHTGARPATDGDVLILQTRQYAAQVASALHALAEGLDVVAGLPPVPIGGSGPAGSNAATMAVGRPPGIGVGPNQMSAMVVNFAPMAGPAGPVHPDTDVSGWGIPLQAAPPPMPPGVHPAAVAAQQHAVQGGQNTFEWSSLLKGERDIDGRERYAQRRERERPGREREAEDGMNARPLL